MLTSRRSRAGRGPVLPESLQVLPPSLQTVQVVPYATDTDLRVMTSWPTGLSAGIVPVRVESDLSLLIHVRLPDKPYPHPRGLAQPWSASMLPRRCGAVQTFCPPHRRQ